MNREKAFFTVACHPACISASGPGSLGQSQNQKNIPIPSRTKVAINNGCIGNTLASLINALLEQ